MTASCVADDECRVCRSVAGLLRTDNGGTCVKLDVKRSEKTLIDRLVT